MCAVAYGRGKDSNAVPIVLGQPRIIGVDMWPSFACKLLTFLCGIVDIDIHLHIPFLN